MSARFRAHGAAKALRRGARFAANAVRFLEQLEQLEQLARLQRQATQPPPPPAPPQGEPDAVLDADGAVIAELKR